MERLVNLVYQFAIPQWTLPWQPIFDPKSANLVTPSFVMLAFRKELQYRNSEFKRLNNMNFSALCTNLVRFSPVSPEFMQLKMTTFAAIQQKSAYHTKYVRTSRTNLYQIYRFGRHMVGGDD